MRGAAIDGLDTLREVERLQFTDTTIEITPIATNTPATGTVALRTPTPAENAAITATPNITGSRRREHRDAPGLVPGRDQPGQLARRSRSTRPGREFGFTPGDAQVGFRLRAVASFQDNDGANESVTGPASAPVSNVNDAPAGAPVANDTTPQEGVEFTATVASITDDDGPRRPLACPARRAR